jgi:hypothetical protein
MHELTKFGLVTNQAVEQLLHRGIGIWLRAYRARNAGFLAERAPGGFWTGLCGTCRSVSAKFRCV